MNEPEYLNLWPAETIQFLPIRRCTLGTLIHTAKRQVSSVFAKCNRTRNSCEDLNDGLYCNRRHGWRFAINFLLNAKFYRIPTDIALSHPAERVVLADIIDCAAKDCSATLVEITDELGDPPFCQLIAFSVLPLVSSHFGSLGSTVLLRGTDRRLADCSFLRLLIHFLQGFAYWNEGRFMSFRRLAKLNSVIRRIPFLILVSPICSVLRLSVHASTKISNI
uniref:Uncharacterized protein n=1 Tax=Solanum tuberosum TaxID=4113 RepID=M1DUN9_SOLTU